LFLTGTRDDDGYPVYEGDTAFMLRYARPASQPLNAAEQAVGNFIGGVTGVAEMFWDAAVSTAVLVGDAMPTAMANPYARARMQERSQAIGQVLSAPGAAVGNAIEAVANSYNSAITQADPLDQGRQIGYLFSQGAATVMGGAQTVRSLASMGAAQAGRLGIPDWNLRVKPYQFGVASANPFPLTAQRVGKHSMYSVGPYNDIKGTVSGMDAHHAGQRALMQELIPGYDPLKAPAILVPKVGHTVKGPNGIVSRSMDGLTTPRSVLARDIKELRRVYPDISNQSLQDLIRMNKDIYPDAF
jgi:hypothetical protein